MGRRGAHTGTAAIFTLEPDTKTGKTRLSPGQKSNVETDRKTIITIIK